VTLPRWSFERLGQVLGGDTGARLGRLLVVALEREPPELGRAWEALLAFESTHAPLEAVVRDKAAPAARRLAALGALVAMSQTELGSRVASGAVTTSLAFRAAMFLVTETETPTAPAPGPTLSDHALQVLLTLTEHAEWHTSRPGRTPPISLRRAWDQVTPDVVRDRLKAGAPRPELPVTVKCLEKGPEACPWERARVVPGLVDQISLTVDRWLALTNVAKVAPPSEISDPLLIAALDKDSREEWIDQSTAARFLGVEKRTLQAYAGKDGFPRSRREGRRKLYPVLALTRWAHSENRACWSDALPDRVRLAIMARVPTTRTLTEDEAIEDGLRKQRDR
jgi:hypothetical protein